MNKSVLLTFLFLLMLTTAKSSFISTWVVEQGDLSITIPTTGVGYDFVVDWGDGTTLQRLVDGDSFAHVYASAGTYTVAITGSFPRIFFNNSSDRLKIRTIEQWGAIVWESMAGAFQGCSRLQLNATDAPDLSRVTDLSSMFENCSVLNADVSGWDVSNVENLNGMFYYATSFNNGDAGNNGSKPLGWGIKTSNVQNMEALFYGTASFNQDISDWDVSSVTTMANMFTNAVIYNNGDVGNNGNKPLRWGNRTAQVQEMDALFFGAGDFNQDISDWDLGSVVRMTNMFSGATSFNNGDVGNNGSKPLAWGTKTAQVQYMNGMFYRAASFNQDISSWDVRNVTGMVNMFFGATSYNNGDVANNESKPLNWGEHTQKVLIMTSMFEEATSFNQDISSWKITGLTNAAGMFKGAKLSIANYDALLISWERQLIAGEAGENIRFHGGESQYCLGKEARANLVEKGWGDGILGGDFDDHTEPTTGIVDGGTLIDDNLSFETDAYVCQGKDLTFELLQSQPNTEYQLYNKADNMAVGSPIRGTGSAVLFTVTPASTITYYVVATNLVPGGCEKRLQDEFTANVTESEGGTLSGSTEVCTGASGKIPLVLSEHKGTIVRWESSVDDFVTVVQLPVTSTNMEVENLTETTSYRAVVQNGNCDETYSSIATIEVQTPAEGGTLSGGTTVCAEGDNSTTLSLSGHKGTIVRWESSVDNFAANTTPITNTTTSLMIENLTETTSYRAVVSEALCGEVFSSEATIVASPLSEGGVVSSDAMVCRGDNRTVLSLSGQLGDVVRWESSTDGFATVLELPVTDTSIEIENLTETTSFRAVVQSGACDEASSSSATIIVQAPAEGGALWGGTTVCAAGGNSTTLSLSGHKGTIVRWESSTDNFTTLAVPIAHTSTNLTIKDLVETTSYRVVLSENLCGEAFSSEVTIEVSPPSAGGILSSDATVCSGNNSTLLALSGHTGDVVRWESSPDDFKTIVEISNTTTNMTVTDLEATTFYRAVVQSGGCDEAFSSAVKVTVNPSSIVMPEIIPTVDVCPGEDAVFIIKGTPGDLILYTSSIEVDTKKITIGSEGEEEIVYSGRHEDIVLEIEAVVNSYGCETILSISAGVYRKDCSDGIKQVNLFSPNNDKINDLFELEGLEYYPDNELKVYNRWGALVYEKKNYTNDWDGYSNITEEQLSGGVYFYVLKINVGDRIFTNYLHLIY